MSSTPELFAYGLNQANIPPEFWGEPMFAAYLDACDRNPNIEPTASMICDSMVQQHLLCECLDSLLHAYRNNLVQWLEHAIMVIGDMSCGCIRRIVQFTLLERRLPTVQEYAAYRRNQIHIIEDPEGYSLSHKQRTPTMNLDQLKSLKLHVNQDCSLCLEQMEPLTEVYRLSCKHHFHSNPQSCLEGQNIVNWLQENSTCPTCRACVIIEPELEKPEEPAAMAEEPAAMAEEPVPSVATNKRKKKRTQSQGKKRRRRA